MLYKFKSKATGDLIMLQANGQQVLQIIGKDEAQSKSPTGIIQLTDMKAAIRALTAAVEAEEAVLKAAGSAALADSLPTPRVAGISLRQRVYPLIEMLRTCDKAGKDVTWGV